MTATFCGNGATTRGGPSASEVVEVQLLLPAGRLEALIALSRRREESVGQIIRQWIDRALALEGA